MRYIVRFKIKSPLLQKFPSEFSSKFFEVRYSLIRAYVVYRRSHGNRYPFARWHRSLKCAIRVRFLFFMYRVARSGQRDSEIFARNSRVAVAHHEFCRNEEYDYCSRSDAANHMIDVSNCHRRWQAAGLSVLKYSWTYTRYVSLLLVGRQIHTIISLSLIRIKLLFTSKGRFFCPPQSSQVTCPGVWLCPSGKVALRIDALDFCAESRRISPIFPLLFHDRFTFSKIFARTASLAELQRTLEREFLYAELIQWTTPAHRRGITLATFEINLADLLYPAPCFKGLLAGVDVDLLMEPTKCFPVRLSFAHL